MSDIQPGQRPDPSSDEAGLWMYMERMEKKLSTSGRIVTDPELSAYIRNIICKLSPEYCNDIRFYVVDTPHFNATMAPNGFMQIWTGLLLRCQNEAQLAYVLGHEIAHYLRRHSVQQWRNVRNTSDVLAFFQLATAAAGVGYAGDIAQLVALGAIFKFSRDQEREADDIGFEMMLQGGYHPKEAAKIWEAIIAERDAADDPEQFIFFSTHPTTEERVKTLNEDADTLVAQGKAGHIQQKEYLAAIGPYRAGWLKDELQKQDFKASQVVLDRLIETGYNLAEIHFFQGEMCRLRGEKGDAGRAVAEYQRALREDNPPPETYRSLGIVHWQIGQKEDARTYFEQYLKMNPEASDSEIIKSYLEALKKEKI
ncbi:MAG: M48 family metalloprotease [Desulfobacteraceae bacterium]